MTAVLVCGGRDYADFEKVAATLAELRRTRGITFVMHGGALGADTLANRWCRMAKVPVEVYYANWEKYGAAAGPKRNERMLKFGMPDFVVAFPGGKGTAHMVSIAQAAGVEVIKVAP